MFLEFSLVHKLTFQMKRHLLLNFFLIYLVSWTLSLQEKLAKMIKKKNSKYHLHNQHSSFLSLLFTGIEFPLHML